MNFVSSGGRVFFFTDRCSFRKEVYMGCYFIFEVG